MPEIGNWQINAQTNAFEPSLMMKKFFGYLPEETMSFEASIAQIVEEYRDKISKLIATAVLNNQAYTIEYPIIRNNDKKKGWLRAHGKFIPGQNGNASTYSTTVWDITEHKELEQRKDDFISIASHELKTPVTSLKATLQLMEMMKHSPEPELMVKLIDQANKSMNKLSDLVEELLNVSRMTEGLITLNKTYFDVFTLLNDCCSHIRLEGKHELIVEGDKELEIYADQHRIDQVVVNLVNNAAKYAPECKDIFLNVETSEESVKVSVRDCGVGIPTDKLPQLFERYYRIDHNTQHQTGLGLGLYISSEIIKRHGGEIGVESEVGKGSTFWFTIPVGMSNELMTNIQ